MNQPDRAIHAPSPQGYGPALELARERWRDLDPQIQAVRHGASVRPGNSVVVVELPFLGAAFEVEHPTGTVRYTGQDAEPDIAERILVLHYLSSQPAAVPDDKVIAFADLPDGRFYNAAFLRRTRDPLIKVFMQDPERLLSAAASLGAERADMGDVSIRLRPFPTFWMYVVLWRGDDEFPGNASVLFDGSVRSILCAEDIAVLAGLVVRRLIRGPVKPKDDLCL